MDRKFLIGLVLTLSIIVFVPVYWAGEPGRERQAQARQTAEAAARGSELFTANCAGCHGQAGEGKIGPALRNTSLDDAALQKTITRGRPGTVMPAWSVGDGGPLKKDQVADLAVLIDTWRDVSAKDNTVPTGVSTTAPVAQPSPTLPPAPAPALAAVTVRAKIVEPSQNSMSWGYDPATVTIRAGDTIVWTNTGQMPHTVTANDGSFDSGLLNNGGSWGHTFTVAGTFSYHCAPHPWMKATVVVLPAG